MQLSESEKEAIKVVADSLGIPESFLCALIDFETAGTWDPQIRNKISGAAGLIQFTNTTAKNLGFKDAADLIANYPTLIEQLKGPVKGYLSQFLPFEGFQDFVMSVFYPAYRKAPEDTAFPSHVQNVNPGIKTVSDYVEMVRGRLNKYKTILSKFFPNLGSSSVLVIAAVLLILLLLLAVLM